MREGRRGGNLEHRLAVSLLDEPFTGAEAVKKDGLVRLLEHLEDEAGSAESTVQFPNGKLS